MVAPLQQTYSVPKTAPIRLGSALNGARLINLSTTGTIWLNPNTGGPSGVGVPLYPGTNLEWQWDGDIWAIGDSGNTANVSVVVTNSITDWQPNPIAIAAAILNSGIIVVDNPATFYTTNGATLTTNAVNAANAAAINTQNYQSIIINVTYFGATNLVNPAFLQIVHFDLQGNDIWVDFFRFQANLQNLNVRVPIKGATVQLSVASNVPGTDTWNIGSVLSNRITQVAQQWSAPQFLIFDNSQTPAAGATTPIITAQAVYEGEVVIYLRATHNAGAPADYLRIYENNAPSRLYPCSAPAGFIANTVYTEIRTTISNAFTGLAFTNTSANAVTGSVLTMHPAQASAVY